MRKLVVQQWVTVDNVAAEEDGGLSFVTVAPFTEDEQSAYKTNVMELIDSVDTMILGANTYAMSKDYWPHAKDQGEYGEKLNGLTKFVASSKLDAAPWGDFPAATVTSDAVATVRELKGQSGKEGHRVQQRPGAPALRDQEVSGHVTVLPPSSVAGPWQSSSGAGITC